MPCVVRPRREVPSSFKAFDFLRSHPSVSISLISSATTRLGTWMFFNCRVYHILLYPPWPPGPLSSFKMYSRTTSVSNGGTVEPQFNEVARDRPNLFVKWRVRYIENLDITNLRGNYYKNVRYIEVIVNDWFVTRVTSGTEFNAIFVYIPRSAAFWIAIN